MFFFRYNILNFKFFCISWQSPIFTHTESTVILPVAKVLDPKAIYFHPLLSYVEVGSLFLTNPFPKVKLSLFMLPNIPDLLLCIIY